MRSKTSFILLVASMLALSPTVQAQSTNAAPPTGGAGGGEGRSAGGGRRGISVEDQLARLKETLGLTAEQEPKVKAILEEQRTARQGMGDLSQEERRAKMQALREEMGKKLKPILTEEQYKKWEAQPQGRRGPQSGERRGPGGEAGQSAPGGQGNQGSTTPPPK